MHGILSQPFDFNAFQSLNCIRGQHSEAIAKNINDLANCRGYLTKRVVATYDTDYHPTRDKG